MMSIYYHLVPRQQHTDQCAQTCYSEAACNMEITSVIPIRANRYKGQVCSHVSSSTSNYLNLVQLHATSQIAQ